MNVDRYEIAGGAAFVAILALVAGFFLMRVEHSIALISFVQGGLK
jgi:hypothetical protein